MLEVIHPEGVTLLPRQRKESAVAQLLHKPGWVRLAPTAILGVFALLMFFTSPTAGDFAWSDAPRHALDGIFVKDFLAAMPLADPRRFAEDYYLRYPALSILFYPPLFSFFLAGCYTIFGFSHAVAQGAVIFAYYMLSLCAYALYRRWLEPVYALAAALLLVAAPEVTYWGRQVMLDIPCYAFLAGSAVFFVAFLDRWRTTDLVLSIVLYVLALYTKQTPLFVAVAFGVALVAARGPEVFLQRRVVVVVALSALLIVPLALMQIKFGQVNVDSVVGSARPDITRLSIEAWTYYAVQLPHQLSWPVVILAIVYILGAMLRPSWRIPSAHAWFLVSWFVAGYLFFSFVMVREPRHDLMTLLPVPLVAMLGIRHIFDGAAAAVGKSVAVCLSIGVALWSAFLYPVQYVAGYQEAARWLMDRAPRNGTILFSGNRDGTFVFNMRAGDRPDLSIARADKVLFRVAIERERGIQDRDLSRAQIEKFIKGHGVRFIVFEPSFWSDMPSMEALKSLLSDDRKFAVVNRIATWANFPQADKTIFIYEYLDELDGAREPLSIDLPGIGKTIEGR